MSKKSMKQRFLGSVFRKSSKEKAVEKKDEVKPVDQAHVYTGCFCKRNPGTGGWGAVIEDGDKDVIKISGNETGSNEARLNMLSIINALETFGDVSRNIMVKAGSDHVRLGITEGIAQWKPLGWKYSRDRYQMVLNHDLWKRLDLLVNKHTIEWQWGKLSSEHLNNNIIDSLVEEEIKKTYKRMEDAIIILEEKEAKNEEKSRRKERWRLGAKTYSEIIDVRKSVKYCYGKYLPWTLVKSLKYSASNIPGYDYAFDEGVRRKIVYLTISDCKTKDLEDNFGIDLRSVKNLMHYIEEVKKEEAIQHVCFDRLFSKYLYKLRYQDRTIEEMLKVIFERFCYFSYTTGRDYEEDITNDPVFNELYLEALYSLIEVKDKHYIEKFSRDATYIVAKNIIEGPWRYIDYDLFHQYAKCIDCPRGMYTDNEDFCGVVARLRDKFGNVAPEHLWFFHGLDKKLYSTDTIPEHIFAFLKTIDRKFTFRVDLKSCLDDKTLADKIFNIMIARPIDPTREVQYIQLFAFYNRTSARTGRPHVKNFILTYLKSSWFNDEHLTNFRGKERLAT